MQNPFKRQADDDEINQSEILPTGTGLIVVSPNPNRRQESSMITQIIRDKNENQTLGILEIPKSEPLPDFRNSNNDEWEQLTLDLQQWMLKTSPITKFWVMIGCSPEVVLYLSSIIRNQPNKSLPDYILYAPNGEYLSHDQLVQIYTDGLIDFITPSILLNEKATFAILNRLKTYTNQLQANQQELEPTSTQINGRTIDLLTGEIEIQGKELPPEENHLTKSELETLKLLIKHANRGMTKEQIYKHLYPNEDWITGNTIEVLINRLRGKLGDKEERQIIKTIRGQGYRLTLREI